MQVKNKRPCYRRLEGRVCFPNRWRSALNMIVPPAKLPLRLFIPTLKSLHHEVIVVCRHVHGEGKSCKDSVGFLGICKVWGYNLLELFFNRLLWSHSVLGHSPILGNSG